MTDFVGAKAALICGDAVLTYLRDNHEGLPIGTCPAAAAKGQNPPNSACFAR
jgi:hypothetical protein